MKPAPFAYVRAETLGHALGLLAEHGDDARVLAGGQSLMASLNMRLSAPRLLVDITRVDGLSGIAESAGGVRIGALARHADVGASDAVSRLAPLVAEAVPHVAHPAIRNRGTFGGSLAFADPFAEFPACALALDARMIVAGPGGERAVEARDFFTGLYETALGAGEILVAVEIPAPPPGRRSRFLEFARRRGDYAVIGLAARAEIADGVFGGARLVFFGAGDRPVPAPGAAALLEGETWSDGLADRLAAALAAELDPPSDLNADGPMRAHLAGVLARRVLGSMAAGDR